MVQSIIYDGSFDGFLSAVFDVYEYKYDDVDITIQERFNGNVFNKPHLVEANKEHSKRVWAGLQKRLTLDAQQQIFRSFLSELPGIENTLLDYIKYAFRSVRFMEQDYSHYSVLTVFQTAKKVWREKHRMEAFVRFQKTADNLFYALIEPDFNVLPLIGQHFETRYADQRWLIYDGKRRYGIYFDRQQLTEVSLNFNAEVSSGVLPHSLYDEGEEFYQQLWQQYFKSVNIAARKNTKLHIQHMPRRYWKYLPEKHPT